jgi:Fic family protein
VRATLERWLFGYIHPYADGNGRMARFPMNVMLASGGYPWTVTPVEERKAYMGSLEKASVDGIAAQSIAGETAFCYTIHAIAREP